MNIKETDIVLVKALEKGFAEGVDGSASREIGEEFRISGKFFQHKAPGWLKVLDVFETEKKMVEQVVVTKRKSADK
jgi:hypothetical protein